ncbi:hypothetical protein Emag_006486 [Eimeria magna]
MEQSHSGAADEGQKGRGQTPGDPPTSPESVRRPEAGMGTSARRPASEQTSPKRKGEEASRVIPGHFHPADVRRVAEAKRVLEKPQTKVERVDQSWDQIYSQEFLEVVDCLHWGRPSWEGFLTAYSREFLPRPSPHVLSQKMLTPHREWKTEIPGKPNNVLSTQAAIQALGGSMEDAPASPPTEEVACIDDEAASVVKEAQASLGQGSGSRQGVGTVSVTSPFRGASRESAPVARGRAPGEMGTPASARQKRKAEGSTPPRPIAREPGSVLPPDLEAFLGAWEAEKLLAERRLEDVRKLQDVAAYMRAHAEGDLQRVSYLVGQGHVFLSAWEALLRRAEREGVLIQERDLTLRASETARAELRRLTEANLVAPAAEEEDRGQQQAAGPVTPVTPKHAEESVEGAPRARTRVTVAVPSPAPAPAIDPQVLQMWQAWWAGTLAMTSRGGLPLPVSPFPTAEARGGPPPPLVTSAAQPVFEGAVTPEGQGGLVETPVAPRTPATRAPQKGLPAAPKAGRTKLAFVGEEEVQPRCEGTRRLSLPAGDAEEAPRSLLEARARSVSGRAGVGHGDGPALAPGLDEVEAAVSREGSAGEATILSPLHRDADVPLASLRPRTPTLFSEDDEEDPVPPERREREAGATVENLGGPPGDDVDRGLGPRRELEDLGSDAPSSVS